jgi:hypothetical protein
MWRVDGELISGRGAWLTHHAYYRCAALFPLVVPILVVGTAILLFAGGSVHPAILESVLIPLFAYLGYSLLLGGIPYIAFMGTALWLLRHKSARAYFRFSVTVPLTFAVLLCMLFEALARIEGIESIQLAHRASVTPSWLGLFLVTAVMGYVYVVPLELLRVRLRRMGTLRDTDHPVTGPRMEDGSIKMHGSLDASRP